MISSVQVPVFTPGSQNNPICILSSSAKGTDSIGNNASMAIRHEINWFLEMHYCGVPLYVYTKGKKNEFKKLTYLKESNELKLLSRRFW